MPLPVKGTATIPETLKAGSFANPQQAKPLIKMVARMFKGKSGKGKGKSGKGLTTGDVKIGHKKVKYW